MSKIINFECNSDVEMFIKKNTYKLIGSGSEGPCYLSKNNKAYKFIEYNTSSKHTLDAVITKDDINLQSFAFPDELYSVGNVLKGYRTDYIPNDLFAPENTYDIRTIPTIDFSKLSKAYKVMYNDILKLSSENILIDDLPFNIIFDGDKLTAIDTCSYKRVSEYPLESNIDSLNSSMELLFYMWFENYKKVDISIKNNDIDKFLDDVYIKLPKTLRKKLDNRRKK